MRIRAELEGLDDLDRSLRLLSDRGEDLQPVLDEAGRELLLINRRTFASEGDGQWAPLAASTVRQRGSAHPILVDSGELRASLTVQGAQGGIYDLTADSVTVGSSMFEARLAQTGTSRGPRRAVVRLTARDRARLVASVQRHLELDVL